MTASGLQTPASQAAPLQSRSQAPQRSEAVLRTKHVPPQSVLPSSHCSGPPPAPPPPSPCPPPLSPIALPPVPVAPALPLPASPLVPLAALVSLGSDDSSTP